MKQTLIILIMLLIALQTFSQDTDSLRSNFRKDLLLKSKNQKSGAWVLLGGGSALIAGGLLLGNRKESSFDDAATGVIIGAVGVLSALGSIPLFLASGRNKRISTGSAHFKLETVPLTLQSPLQFRQYPAACLKINL